MKRIFSALCIVALALPTLAGCSQSASVQLISGSTINIAQIGSLASINTDVADTAQSADASELANLTVAKFYELNSNGTMVANTKLGTVTVVKKSPLTVRYTLSTGAKWSDGTAIDAADLALSFAAGSSLGGADFGSVRKGSGVSFASLASPVEVGGRSITLKFSRAVADYENALTLAVPANVVASRVDPSLTAATDQKKLVVDAVNSKNAGKLASLAEFYQSTFDVKLHVDATTNNHMFDSSGAYRVEKINSLTDLTLVANDNYQLGNQTRIERIHLVYFADATLAVAAMAKGEIDLATAEDSGLASLSDIKSLASAVKKPKIYQALGAGIYAEQVVFNFGGTSVFSNQAANGKQLRLAFLHAVPKQRIIAAINALYSVTASDSFIFSNDAAAYENSVAKNGSSDFAFQDVQKAAELTAGNRLPIQVRVLFDSTNPRASAEWTLLQERASHAGFELLNVSSANPAETLASGEYDVYLGARELTSAPGADVYALTSGSAFNFTDSSVSKLLEKLAASTSTHAATKLLERVDQELFAANYGLPLYEVPSMLLYTARVKGFVPAPFASSDTWGYYNWSVATK